MPIHFGAPETPNHPYFPILLKCPCFPRTRGNPKKSKIASKQPLAIFVCTGLMAYQPNLSKLTNRTTSWEGPPHCAEWTCK